MSGARITLSGWSPVCRIRSTPDFEIYQARRGDKFCALKMMRPRYPSVAEKQCARASLEREIRALRSLRGTGAARLLADGEASGRRYAAIEWIDGPSVERQALLLRRSNLPPPERWRQLICLVESCASELAGIHALGWLHGDINPQNFVVECGRARLINFEIASQVGLRDVELRRVRFSRFSSPEAAATLLHDRTPIPEVGAEIFSIGALAYFLLTGQYAHEPSSAVASTVRRITTGRIRSFRAAGYSPYPAAEAILRKAMNVDAGRRYRSANELARAFAGLRRSSEYSLARGYFLTEGELGSALALARQASQTRAILGKDMRARRELISDPQAKEIMHLIECYRSSGDRRFLESARLSGLRTARNQAVVNGPRGLVGQGYSLLALSRIDPEGPWYQVAIDLARQSLMAPTRSGMRLAAAVLRQRRRFSSR